MTAVTEVPTIAEYKNIGTVDKPIMRYRWRCNVCGEHGTVWYANATMAITAGKLIHQEQAHGLRIDNTYPKGGDAKR